MNLSEIKSKLGYSTLNLNTAQDAEKKDTEWMRHWDNEERIAVSIHKDTIKALQGEGGDKVNLDIQTGTRDGAQGSYITKRIVMFTPAELTL
jgi:hypothetical protein